MEFFLFLGVPILKHIMVMWPKIYINCSSWQENVLNVEIIAKGQE